MCNGLDSLIAEHPHEKALLLPSRFAGFGFAESLLVLFPSAMLLSVRECVISLPALFPHLYFKSTLEQPLFCCQRTMNSCTEKIITLSEFQSRMSQSHFHRILPLPFFFSLVCITAPPWLLKSNCCDLAV